MACENCDHTMQGVIPGVFWCPRCGTIKSGERQDAPKLVGRVVEFAGKLTDEHQDLIEEFERLGVREAIMKDEEMI